MLKNVKNTTIPSLFNLLSPHSCRGCGRIGTPLCDRCKNYILRTTQPFCPYCKAALPPASTCSAFSTPASTCPTFGLHAPTHHTLDIPISTCSALDVPTSNPSFVHRPCPDCANNPALPPVYSVGNRFGLLDLILHEYKYQSLRALGRPLAELLDARLPQLTLTSSDKLNRLPHETTITPRPVTAAPHPVATAPRPVVIVPLPTATHHIRARGFDHTLHLARQLARLRGYTVQPLLVRAKNTTQVGTDKDTREKQADSAYTLASHLTIDPTTIYLLLDDISTTGATLQAATKKLRQAGASHISIAVLAISA